MSGSENQENLGMTKNGNAANGHSIPALRPPRFLSAQNQSDGYYANSQLPGNPISYINTNSTPTPPSDEDDSALFGNLLQIGWQRKWTILLCTLCGLVAGIVYLSRATPIYESTAVIYMDQAQPQIISENFGSGFAAQHSMSAQRQVLTSTSMLSRALEVPSMKQADSIWAATNPIGYVRKHLTVDFDESEEILLISMRSPSPEDNAITVNSLVQAYSEYHSDRRSHTAAEVLNVLHNEKLRLNKELDELAQQQLEFQKENGVAALRTKDGDSVFGNRLERLADTLAEAELLTLSAKTAYQSALHAGTDSDALRIVAVADPNYSKLEQNAAASTADAPERTLISNLYLERTRLVEAKGLGPGHYLITEIDAQIDMLNQALSSGTPFTDGASKDFLKLYLEILEQRWKSAEAAEAEYRELYQKQESESVAINSLFAEHANLESRAVRADRQLAIVDERIRELNLNDDYDIIDVTILEPALAAALPISPQRSKTLALALMLSLMAGYGLAYLQEMMDDRVRSGEEISSLLKQPILGVIPAMAEKSVSECGQTVDLKPQSVVAEAFRTVRTAIHFNPHGLSTQVLMVTSPSPGDGKSTVASNLAIAIAQSGKKTLLIDADCRKPRQHRIFDLEAERGLSSLLIKKGQGTDKMESPIVHTDCDHLDLLPCGPLPHSPAEMLNSKRFTKLLDKLRDHYDQIVIDTPPTIPVSDSRIISASIDGYVLVLRAGKSGRKMAKHATELLSSVGAPPVGLVINGVTNSWGSYSYYSRYGYYQYGYGAYREEEDPKPRKLGFGKSVALPNITPDEEEVKV